MGVQCTQIFVSFSICDFRRSEASWKVLVLEGGYQKIERKKARIMKIQEVAVSNVDDSS